LNYRENNVGPIEESMRKYCEDKKTVMFKPEVGMEFYSSEEAYQFYNMYSWVAGFSIRLGDNYTNKKKQRTMQEYLCQRQVHVKPTYLSYTNDLKYIGNKIVIAEKHILNIQNCSDLMHYMKFTPKIN
jgi:hypothetical protein